MVFNYILQFKFKLLLSICLLNGCHLFHSNLFSFIYPFKLKDTVGLQNSTLPRNHANSLTKLPSIFMMLLNHGKVMFKLGAVGMELSVH